MQARLTTEKGRQTRRKVGRRVRAQVPTGKNNHGDSEEADKAKGRRAQVQAEARTAEKRGWLHSSGVRMQTSRPDHNYNTFCAACHESK